MKRCIPVLLLSCLLLSLPALAQEDVLGLYFSDTTFTLETASASVPSGSLLAGYIVLTGPTGAVINGYEVGISSSAPDFAIPMTNLTFDTNDGDNLNQIITFMTPKPALAEGTVLATVFLSTASTAPETISFAAASPSSVGGVAPAVDYSSGPAVACSPPWDAPYVAWLNGQPVATDRAAWDEVKALFR